MAPTKPKLMQKARNRTKEQEETEEVTDPLKEAISALGGDDKDYALLKGVDDDHDLVVSGSHADESKLSKDVAKFIKSLQIPKQQSQWVVKDEETSGSERSSSEYNEKTKDTPPVASAVAPAKGKAPKYLFPPTSHWYSVLPPLPPYPALQAPSEHTITSLSAHAEALLKQDVHQYSHTESGSDAKFLSRVLTSGTLSDQLSALTLMVQASPLHNQKALESLRSMAGKKSRSESLKALRAIVDWWVGGGSPDRKLKYFRDQPLNHPGRDSHLMVWYYEDWLKKYFFSLLQSLETLTLDPLPYVRTQAMALVSGLLISKPEQEHNLLRLLVNKLGDSERSVASKASYHLLTILQTHPQMKGIIVREVATLILKAPTSTTTAASNRTIPQPAAIWNAHARYFAVITFNQIVLSKADTEVASKLIDVYFELFKGILGEGKETDADGAAKVEDGKENGASGKTMAKGREGRRARAMENLNYTKATGKGKEKEQAKHKFVEAQGSESKVISAILTGINRALPFAGIANERLNTHIDTLFRVSHSATFNVSIQALVLMQQVSTGRPVVQPRYYRALYATLLDSRLASSSKQAMFLNLLFKSLKADQDLKRVKALVKRFLQVLSSGVGCGGEPSFICGGLFLLGELFTTTPGLRDAVSQPERSLGGAPDEYDPRKREPEYCNAAGSCIWELIPLLSHYHPSVSLHARQFLEGVQMTATADLGLNTLSHFLDLFVYKNPKKVKSRGSSAMQPAAALGNDTGTIVRLIKGMGAASEQNNTRGTLNNEVFWKKKVEEVPVNQLFFHRFFMKKMERTQAIAEKVEKRKGVKVAEEEEDMEDMDAEIPAQSKKGVDEPSSNDEGFDEDEVWKAMKSSMAEVAEPDSDESDSLRSDLDGDSDDVSLPMEKNSNQEDESEEDGWGTGFDEDEDDLVGSDIDAPDGLLPFGSDEEAQEEEEWGGIGTGATVARKKRKAKEQRDGGRRKKRRLRDLPTFASVDQYAKLIDEADEENL